jgi:hypothetical protein
VTLMRAPWLPSQLASTRLPPAARRRKRHRPPARHTRSASLWTSAFRTRSNSVSPCAPRRSLEIELHRRCAWPISCVACRQVALQAAAAAACCLLHVACRSSCTDEMHTRSRRGVSAASRRRTWRQRATCNVQRVSQYSASGAAGPSTCGLSRVRNSEGGRAEVALLMSTRSLGSHPVQAQPHLCT